MVGRIPKKVPSSNSDQLDRSAISMTVLLYSSGSQPRRSVTRLRISMPAFAFFFLARDQQTHGLAFCWAGLLEALHDFCHRKPLSLDFFLMLNEKEILRQGESQLRGRLRR